MKTEQDLRVLKTLEHIKSGFSLCVSQKTIKSITIKDISTAAKVNRSTFYTYYTDKYHLRDELVKATLQDLDRAIDLTFITFDDQSSSQTRSVIVQHLEHLWSQKEWYLLLWNKNLELYVFEDMQSLLENKIRNIFTQEDKDEFSERKELFARLYASTTMSILKWWYEVAPTTSAAKVADIIYNHWELGMHRTFF